MTFAERPRCLRVALGALDHLFNATRGYAYPTNAAIADMTGLPINKVQEALLTLEADGAIVRVSKVNGSRKQRLIYPSTALLPSAEVTPTVGVGGHPQQVGVQNLRRTRSGSPPRTEHERARLSAELTQRRRGESGPPTKHPSTLN
jgi:hypothetical protein